MNPIIKPYLIGLALPTIVLTLFTAANLTSDQFSFQRLSEDPWHTVPGMHPLYSAGTNIYLLGWAATVGICLLTWLATRDRFFLVIGGFTAMLWLDDAFMIHEYWTGQDANAYAEKAVLVTYGLVAWLVVMVYRRTFAAVRPDLLLLVVVLFAGSLLADRPNLQQRSMVFVYADDSLKMLGIYAWLTWVVLAALAALPTFGKVRA